MVREQGYVCSYVDPMTGHKCSSVYGLEKDHRQSWSKGGPTAFHNLRFLCRNHHRRVSFVEFGEARRYFKRP